MSGRGDGRKVRCFDAQVVPIPVKHARHHSALPPKRLHALADVALQV